MALADFAAGANNAIQEILKKRLLEQRYQDSLKQQAFQNDLATRGANRADEQLKATTENNRLIREAQQQNTNNTRAQQIVDRAEPDTFYADTDPTARMIRGTDYASFLKPVQPTQAMGSDFQGPMPDAETPQQAQVGRQGGFLKMATSTQANQESQRLDRIADNNRQDAQEAARNARDQERDKAEALWRNANLQLQRDRLNQAQTPAPPRLIQVDTIDENGNHVVKTVPETEGAVYPKYDPVSASTRQMGETANAILPHISSVQKEAEELNKLGLMGPIQSRWRDFVAGKIGANELAGGNKDAARLIGKFRSDLGLLKTATARAHGGARAAGSPGMLRHMDTIINGTSDFPGFVGSLDAVRDWMQGYADDANRNRQGGKSPAASSGRVKTYDLQGNVVSE